MILSNKFIIFLRQILLKKIYIILKLIIIFVMDIIAIIPCIIIRLISPIYTIRIARMAASNFGDFVWMPAMYYCKKKLKIDQPKKKYIDLVYIHYSDKIYNKQIAKMWKKKFNFLPFYLLDPIARVNKLIPGWQKHTIKNLVIQERDINNLFEKYQALDFTTEEETHGKETLKKFGLKNGDKFVCLAVRDKSFQLEKISSGKRNWNYHDFRHTNIDKFFLAAEELTKRGYYVFRMGVTVEKEFSSPNKMIIDYANSELRSDFMDVYLGAKCSFCISTGYGFQDLPGVFKKPLIEISTPLGNACTHNKKYMIMTKHHINKKNGKALSLSEIFSSGAAFTYTTEGFNEKDIELIENTPDEIKDLTIEMVDKLEGKQKLNEEDQKMQNIFKDLYSQNIRKVDYHSTIKNEYDNHKKPFHGEVRSIYSNSFIRKNRGWLK